MKNINLLKFFFCKLIGTNTIDFSNPVDKSVLVGDNETCNFGAKVSFRNRSNRNSELLIILFMYKVLIYFRIRL